MAIAFDSSASAVSLTVAHTIAASGNDRILVACYHGSSSTESGATMASCTYDGVSATGSFSVVSTLWGNCYAITVFYWLEEDLPSSAGTYNCVATTNSGVWNYAGITTSFTGVDQSVSPTTNTATSIVQNTGQSNVGITTTQEDAVIIDAGGRWASANTDLSVASGQTEVQEVSQNSQGDMAVGYEMVSTAQAYTQSWTFANEYAWQAAAIAFYAPSEDAPQYDMLWHNF